MKIFIVDDDKEALVALKRLLQRQGYNAVETCDNGQEAIGKIKKNDYDLILLDLLLPDVNGLQVLEETKAFKPETEFIMITAVDDIQTAVKSVRLGAYDYLVKPVDPDRIFLSIERAYERKGLLKGFQSATSSLENINEVFKNIITNSIRMKEIFSFTEIMAKSGNPILLTGDSGTGKELFAQAIHQLSSFRDGPFVPVNVASVPQTLFESQFFGHLKGSFTGADNNYTGYFQQANNGTLFLDEIGELPKGQQVKFLRILEDKMITPIGDQQSHPVNLRFISATNIDIDSACRDGKFRLDLLYRLKSVHIHLPTLNEREGDIPFLANYFLDLFNKKYKKNITRFDPDVMEWLTHKKYTGNVRELKQLVENAVILCSSGTIEAAQVTEMVTDVSKDQKDKKRTLKENNDLYIARIYKQTGRNKRETARILNISLRQVQRKIAELQSDPRFQDLSDDNIVIS